jgi:Protein of unknown function (DUF402)
VTGAHRERLDKVKRPAGIFWYELVAVAEDEHGAWLHGPVGTRWGAPHAVGTLPVAVLVLLRPQRPWAVWWVADPADRRIELDVCLPPERTGRGWRYVDLELDPVRHERTSRIEIEDEDELEESRRRGWMSPGESELARRAAGAGVRLLGQPDQAWSARGWRRLAALTPPAAP